MTVSYFRDLSKEDTLIVASSEGCYAIDLKHVTASGVRRVQGIPPSAHRVNAADVGRIIVCACNRSIRECEESMEAIR